jgi:hypothetical protein
MAPSLLLPPFRLAASHGVAWLHGSMGISPCSPHRTAAQHLASFAPCAATSCQQHRVANDLDLTPPASTSHGVHRDRRRNRTVAVAISHGVGRAAATAQDL